VFLNNFDYFISSESIYEYSPLSNKFIKNSSLVGICNFRHH